MARFIRGAAGRRWAAAVLAGTALLGVPAAAFGAGAGAVPSSLSVEDVAAGSDVFRLLTLSGSVGADAAFRFEFGGDIAGWLAVVDPVDREPVESVVDEGDGVETMVRVSVPEDAEPGEYRGEVHAILDPADPEEGESTVGVVLVIPVSVVVSGTRVVGGEVLTVAIDDSEVGVPVRVRATVRNSGNVTVLPELTLDIAGGGATVFRSTETGSALFPDETDTFELTWETGDATPGEYTARVAVSLDELALDPVEESFVLHPPGTLLRSVVFEDLRMTNDPGPGGVARFEAVAFNPGDIEVSVGFVGTLARGGEVVDEPRSVDYTLGSRQRQTIPIVVELTGDGEFVLEGRLASDAGDTESRTVAFTVGGGASSVLWAVGIFGVGGLAAAAARVRGRSRRGEHSRSVV